GRDRAVVRTVAPPEARRFTTAAPIPLVPPVTRTRLPANSAVSRACCSVCIIQSAWFKRGPIQVTVRTFSGPAGSDRLALAATGATTAGGDGLVGARSMRLHQVLTLLVGFWLTAGCHEHQPGGQTGPRPEAKPTPEQAEARSQAHSRAGRRKGLSSWWGASG